MGTIGNSIAESFWRMQISLASAGRRTTKVLKRQGASNRTSLQPIYKET